ncbi:MAG: hypothetical protein GX754_12485 [Clostridiaceae bacterium]|nr:hypothetical protein [Clostridiaceae bacterium]
MEIFKKDDIPAGLLPGDSPFRFSCLAYYYTREDTSGEGENKEEDTITATAGADRIGGILVFALQTFNGRQNTDGESIKPSVSLLCYSLEDKTFRLIDKISNPSGGITCSNLTLDTTGRYAAIDLFQEGPEIKNYVLVYDIDSGEKVDIGSLLEIQDAFRNSVLWSENGLVFCARVEQQSMNYLYKPEMKKAEAF